MVLGSVAPFSLIDGGVPADIMCTIAGGGASWRAQVKGEAKAGYAD